MPSTSVEGIVVPRKGDPDPLAPDLALVRMVGDECAHDLHGPPHLLGSGSTVPFALQSRWSQRGLGALLSEHASSASSAEREAGQDDHPKGDHGHQDLEDQVAAELRTPLSGSIGEVGHRDGVTLLAAEELASPDLYLVGSTINGVRDQRSTRAVAGGPDVRDGTRGLEAAGLGTLAQVSVHDHSTEEEDGEGEEERAEAVTEERGRRGHGEYRARSSPADKYPTCGRRTRSAADPAELVRVEGLPTPHSLVMGSGMTAGEKLRRACA